MNAKSRAWTAKTIHNIIFVIFFGGIFLLPFVYWPWAAVPYELPRVFFILRWIEVLVILSAVNFNYYKSRLKQREVFNALSFTLMLFVVVALVASIQGSDLDKSLLGNYLRGDGLLTQWHFVALFFFLQIFWKQEYVRPFMFVTTTGSVVLSILTLSLAFEYIRESSMTGFGDVSATFGNPNFLAGYLAVSLPFIMYGIVTSRSWTAKVLFIIGLAIQAAAIITVHSIGGYIGLGVALLLSAGFISRKLLLGAGAISVLVCVFIAVKFVQYQRDVIYMKEPYMPESRERIMIKSALAFEKRPLLGWGWANYDYGFEAVDWPVQANGDVYVDKAHSTVMEVLVTTGLVGFVLYLLLIAQIARPLFEIHSHETMLWLIVLCTFMIHAQTNIISINEELFFWIIASIAITLKPAPQP